MKFTLFLLICFPCCFAQTNPMEYFYEGRSEIPDFAALAVLERQNCPNPVALSYERYKEQICTSRYRIIKVLDAASDTLKKEYLEVKEKPRLPYFRHRPMLIFGKHENGMIQIKEYEETGGYFFPYKEEIYYSHHYIDNFPLDTAYLGYMLRSIGTPYHDLRNLDSIDIMFYNSWMPFFKDNVEKAGKNFGELQRRLVQNREPIKAARIKNDFAALGTIKSIRPASDFRRTNLYELNVTIKTIFKNDAKIDSNTAIFISREHLPLNWDCPASEFLLLKRKYFYLLGDLKDGNLFIDSLIFPRDAFVFGDTIYDMSMGFPLKELFAYFLPSNVSFEELEFGEITQMWGTYYKFPDNQPECLKKDFEKISIRYWDYFKNSQQVTEIGKMRTNFIENLDEETRKLILESPSLNRFQTGCRNCSGLRGKGVWGRKW